MFIYMRVVSVYDKMQGYGVMLRVFLINHVNNKCNKIKLITRI